MTAKGKINASKVQAGDRVIVAPSKAEGRVNISSTKTGEGVHVARVVYKVKATNARGYVVVTTSGEFYADPIETMWLAPEDNAGIKRAHVEALAEDAERAAQVAQAEMDEATANQATPQYRYFAEITRSAGGYRNAMDALHADALAEDSYRESEAALAAEDEAPAECPECDGPLASDGVCADDSCGADEDQETSQAEDLTLDSHDGKVDNMNNESTATETQTAPAKNHTGSTVVSLLEKVWTRIREDHLELPEVVITTGSGEGVKWGHFRAESWKVRAEEGAAVSENGPGRRHELFLASEALAKGSSQVLQTMLHEGAHTLSRVRNVKDTSRQGRWHNATFRKAAEEMGLEHKASSADKSHGFAFVSLTASTKARYADLLAELDAEIRLTGLLPAWLGGTGDEDEQGGEKITGKPKSGETKTSGNLKATCKCTEPVIIRLSQKVLDLGVVKCDACDSLFTAA